MKIIVAIAIAALAFVQVQADDDKCNDEKKTYDNETCACWDQTIGELLPSYDELVLVKGVRQCVKELGDNDDIKGQSKELNDALKKLVSDYQNLKDDKCDELNKIRCRIESTRGCIESYGKNIKADEKMTSCIRDATKKSITRINHHINEHCENIELL